MRVCHIMQSCNFKYQCTYVDIKVRTHRKSIYCSLTLTDLKIASNRNAKLNVIVNRSNYLFMSSKCFKENI